MINSFFNWCVHVLEVIGDITGMGYELANIVIFGFTARFNIVILHIMENREK